MKKEKLVFVFAIAAALALTACKGGNDGNVTPYEMPGLAETLDTAEQVSVEPLAEADDYFEKMVAKPAPKPKPKVAPKPKQEPAETIYVETDGAQGRVWGHVTMRGDRGSGTIHDWDENTLTVSVTRHGDELFAVDQNSRQYVFKLKK